MWLWIRLPPLVVGSPSLRPSVQRTLDPDRPCDDSFVQGGFLPFVTFLPFWGMVPGRTISVCNLDPHYDQWERQTSKVQITVPKRLPNNHPHAWSIFDEIFHMEFSEISYKLFWGTIPTINMPPPLSPLENLEYILSQGRLPILLGQRLIGSKMAPIGGKQCWELYDTHHNLEP